MGYAPISIFTDCGNGYGVALVQDGDKDPVRADVDLNDTDNTSTPRIQVNGAWVDADQVFVAAYRRMKSSKALVGNSRAEACRAINGGKDPAPEAGTMTSVPSTRNPKNPAWLVLPTVAMGVAYAIDTTAGSGVPIAVRDPGSIGTVLNLGQGALTTAYMASWIPISRRLNHGPFLVANTASLVAGAGLMAMGLNEKNRRGTPEFSAGLNLASTAGLGFLYGDVNSSGRSKRFYTGLLIQGGLGVAELGLGLRGVLRHPAVLDEHVPPGMAGVQDGSGYRDGRLPGFGRDLVLSGIANLVGAGINWLDRPAGGSPVQVGAMTPPGGGAGLQVSGTF